MSEVHVLIGQVGLPGAPVLRIDAVIDEQSGRIVGTAEITQAIHAPYGQIFISNVTGNLRPLSMGGSLLMASLTGTFSTPPAHVISSFSATLVIDDNSWSGRGSFSYGGQHVVDVPVVQIADPHDVRATDRALAGSTA